MNRSSSDSAQIRADMGFLQALVHWAEGLIPVTLGHSSKSPLSSFQILPTEAWEA
jgi:hypothetical protein